MRLRLLLFLSIFIAEAKSQNIDSVAQLSLDTIISVNANRLESRPAFHLIGKAMMDLNDGISTQTVLNQVPGVYMHSGTLSTNRITIRGVGNRSPFATSKIRAYFNDIPLTSGIGETSLEDIDLGLIDEIEIWKGPTASRYGAGLGGLIHYQTSSRTPGISLETKLGSFGLVRTSENIVLNNNSGTTQVRINHNFTKREGWRENSKYQRQGIALLVDNKGPRHKLNFLFHHIDLLGQIPSSLNQDDFENNPEKAAFTWKQVQGFEDYKKTLSGISYTSIWPGNWQLNSSVSYLGRTGNESRPFNILEDSNSNITARLVLNREINKMRMKTGVELYGDRYNWETFETTLGTQGPSLDKFNERRKYINIFSEINLEINPKWTIEAGLNLNRSLYSIKDPPPQIPNDFAFHWIVSPNANLTYKPSLNHNLYLTTSHGFSNPTLEETLTPEGDINSSIGPETGWNFELGAKGYLVADNLSYDISVYRMHIKNLLVTRTYPDLNNGFDQIISENAGETLHSGLDALLQYQILKRKNTELSISGTYSFQNFVFKDFVDDENNYSNNQLTGTIPHRFFGILKFTYLNLDITSQFQFTDEIPMRDDNSIFSEPYKLMHLKATYVISLNKKLRLQATLGLNNIFDQGYASMILVNAGSFGGNAPRYFYPGNPKNWYGGVKMNYSF